MAQWVESLGGAFDGIPGFPFSHVRTLPSAGYGKVLVLRRPAGGPAKEALAAAASGTTASTHPGGTVVALPVSWAASLSEVTR